MASRTFSSEGYTGKDGRKITLTVTDTLYTNSATTNKSRVTWSLNTTGGWEYAQYYDTYCYVSINGHQVYFSNGTMSTAGYSGWIVSNTGTPEGIWYDSNGIEYTCAKRNFSTSGSLDVVHDANGSKTINVTFLVGIFYYSVTDCGGSFTLTSIDRSGPTITQNNVSGVTYNSCTISASSNVNCDYWQYRYHVQYGSWGPWIAISGSGTSKSTTVSSLSPNTTYEFQFQAAKASNGVYASSGIKSCKTLGASILNSVTMNITIPISGDPTLHYKFTSYSNTFYHRLRIYNDTSFLNFNLGAGVSEGDITLSRTTLLDWIGNSFVKTGLQARLYTCSDSGYTSQVGNTSIISGITIRIDKSAALPTLTIGTPAYQDTNAATIAQTGDSKYIIVGSNVRLNSINAHGNMGASITQLTAKLGPTSRTLTLSSGAYSGNYNWGTISSKQYGLIELTAVDSRGLVATLYVLMYILSPGELIEDSDYNAWYDILNKHYSGRDYNSNYYVSGTTAKQFHLSSVNRSNLAKASEITFGDSATASIAGLAGAVSRLPHVSSSEYYYPVSADIEAIAGYISNVLAGNRELVINSPNASVNASTETLSYTGNAVTVSSRTASITSAHGAIDIETLILASLKSIIDTHMSAIDNIVLFNLVEG